MLAQLGKPFDSPDHIFEWKWDGFRALAFRDADGYRLRSRNDHDLKKRFPELKFLQELPPGTVVDGEIVVLVDGQPNFEILLGRERSRSGDAARLAKVTPAIFVAFDLLFQDYTSICQRPLRERRERLEALLATQSADRFVFSEGLVGNGLALFEQAVARDFEGVVGKRLDSLYLLGKRSDAWIKFKKSSTIYCVIIGYLERDDGDLRSVIVATDVEGTLTCVGRVGSGIDASTRRVLLEEFRGIAQTDPAVPTDLEGKWVQPSVFCLVSFVEKTRAGMLRAPVWKERVRS